MRSQPRGFVLGVITLKASLSFQSMFNAFDKQKKSVCVSVSMTLCLYMHFCMCVCVCVCVCESVTVIGVMFYLVCTDDPTIHPAVGQSRTNHMYNLTMCHLLDITQGVSVSLASIEKAAMTEHIITECGICFYTL